MAIYNEAAFTEEEIRNKKIDEKFKRKWGDFTIAHEPLITGYINLSIGWYYCPGFFKFEFINKLVTLLQSLCISIKEEKDNYLKIEFLELENLLAFKYLNMLKDLFTEENNLLEFNKEIWKPNGFPIIKFTYKDCIIESVDINSDDIREQGKGTTTAIIKYKNKDYRF